MRLKPYRLACAPLVCGLAGAVQAQGVAPPEGPGFDSVNLVYRCTGGARLPVVYLNLQGGDAFATTYINGHLVLMKSGPTGSGARYVAVQGQAGYRWHVKGEVGSLFFQGPEPGAREALLLQDCKVQRQP